MFTITFYSYKGGVGRTMGLVNVAAELAQRGRKVLIVDFDLEAPGIPSFKQFSASDGRVGVVDYVTKYIDTSVAPDVSDFIVETNLETPSGSAPVWVIPAGKRDESYGQKLSSIDWQDLYENRSGYLLFEDLKQQIQADIRWFDYVLIDSRTGHTDVGGICTRQLADAITFMFFPNSQNISGLKTIVSEIRSDRHVGSKQTKLLFCPSNVPDLDDEDGILKAMLDDASRELGYEKPSATIRHYNSMSLIDQKIFVIDRPRTKLAAEYRSLTEALVQWNLEDRDGAVLALRRMTRELRARSQGGSRGADARPIPLNEIIGQLESISSIHGSDGEICWLMASLYHELGDFANEMEALSGAINAGVNVQKAHLNRAFILLSQSRRQDAQVDLHAVIGSPVTAPIELRSAIEALKIVDPHWIDVIERSPILEKLLPEDVSIISNALLTDATAVPVALRILVKGHREADGNEGVRADLCSDLVLALISSGEFTEAMKTIGDSRANVLRSGSIQDVFNYAMAEWGQTGSPSDELFDHVLGLGIADPDPEGANFYQCLALASAITRRGEDAFEYLGKAKELAVRGPIFSCWRYLYGGRPEMLVDLDAMEEAFKSGNIKPPVFQRNVH
ncbi:tetratricopeptide repeat-containing protein (plasmid) [Rhizobium gallicum bv. gallicum R602sp]|uniref:Tetratricopeptide repeat-containing protein n=1 Tax=Rhizobium gallicum bv. gallicum R602sp TaxID=1041138 RepID=A0A0B4X7I7_9HYPH|nr:AAA family ATPase [Rhizobium gallicum]AJD43954.1 tetratricopeptide repeat-containing protein [Rhizobium gallicum bv. gallicum R602sp]TDW16234.1 cellulose biosynthesis protein BcsQ [Rhizobium azibense]